jgi:hypothetical protein
MSNILNLAHSQAISGTVWTHGCMLSLLFLYVSAPELSINKNFYRRE